MVPKACLTFPDRGTWWYHSPNLPFCWSVVRYSATCSEVHIKNTLGKQKHSNVEDSSGSNIRAPVIRTRLSFAQRVCRSKCASTRKCANMNQQAATLRMSACWLCCVSDLRMTGACLGVHQGGATTVIDCRAAACAQRVGWELPVGYSSESMEHVAAESSAAPMKN